MIQFIEKTYLTSNLSMIYEEADSLITKHGWSSRNQIGLTHRHSDVNIWHDSTIALYDKKTKFYYGREYDYVHWNLPETSYIRQQVELLRINEKLIPARVRIMKLSPKTGLASHRDGEIRYHFAIKTNKNCYISQVIDDSNELEIKSISYHIPLDSYWYRVNTRVNHWVYNADDTNERIHLVISGCTAKYN